MDDMREWLQNELNKVLASRNMPQCEITKITYNFNNIHTKQDSEDFVTYVKEEYQDFKTGKTHTFTLDYAPMDPKFVNWIGACRAEPEPVYKQTGVVAHNYRKKTYAPKLKRMLR